MQQGVEIDFLGRGLVRILTREPEIERLIDFNRGLYHGLHDPRDPETPAWDFMHALGEIDNLENAPQLRQNCLELLVQSVHDLNMPEFHEKFTIPNFRDTRHLEMLADSEYISEVFNFSIQFGKKYGKSQALFEALMDLVTYEEITKRPMSPKGFVPPRYLRALAAHQTDRGLQPTWEIMLSGGVTMPGSVYPSMVDGGMDLGTLAETGYKGLLHLPPLRGDVNEIPADVIPKALLGYAWSLERANQSEEEKNAETKSYYLNHRYRNLLEHFGKGRPIGIVRDVLDSTVLVWPLFARELFDRIRENSYAPLNLALPAR